MRRAYRILMLAAWCALFAPLTAQTKDNKNKKADAASRSVGTGINFYSIEREIALGKQLAQEVARNAKFVENAAAGEYVNRLAQNLARNSDVKVPVVARLIDSNEVNAFALPGGFLFVNAGILLHANTEAELVAVMAHEIAHVAARHGTRQASRGQVADIASIPLIFLGGWAGFAVRQGAGLAIPLTFLKFSRGFENEADSLAVQYMYRCGYDPGSFIDFFERMEAMEKRKPGTTSALFRSHPDLGSRIKLTQSNVQQLPSEQALYVIDTSEFQQMKQWLTRASTLRGGAPGNSGPTLRRPGERPNGEKRTDPEATDPDERPTLTRRNTGDGRATGGGPGNGIRGAE